MKTLELIEYFQVRKPATLEDVQNFVKVRLIGQGVYRKVYKVVGHNLILKVSNTPETKSGQNHSVSEYRAVKRIKRESKFSVLRSYMPDIYYCNTKTGLLLMERYKPIPETNRTILIELLNDLVETVYDYKDGKDLHSDNVMIDKWGMLKIIDLGYFSDLGK